MNKIIDNDVILTKLSPLLEMEFILNLSGNKERSDFIYQSNIGEYNEVIIWNGEKRVLTDKLSSTLMVLHPTKPIIAYIQDTNGNEDYYLLKYDYQTNKSTKLCEESLGDISQIIWLANDEVLISGFNNSNYFIKKVSSDYTISEIFTTNEQILNLSYDQTLNYLTLAIGRKNTQIAILNLSNPKSIRWLKKENRSLNFPRLSSDGLLVYSSSSPNFDELIIRDIETLNEILKIDCPGSIGKWVFDNDAIQWIDTESLLLKVAKNVQISPFIFNIVTKKWSDPLTDLSIEKAIVSKSSIVWYGSKLDQSYSLEMLHNNEVITISKPSTLFDITYESFWFPSYGEQKIHGWLIKNSDPLAPLLIYCHGGPTYSIRNCFEPFLHAFVLGGFNVFAINYRGSDNFGAKYRDLNVGDMGGADLLDIISGTKFIKRLLNINQPVRIFGESYGAYLSLLALTKYPDDWLSGVAWSGNLDLAFAYQIANSHYKSFYSNFLGGTLDEKPLFYKERSPITYITQLKTPTLIIQGENDSRVPLEPLFKVLDYTIRYSLPIETSISNDGHSSRDAENVVKNIILSIQHLMNRIRGKDC